MNLPSFAFFFFENVVTNDRHKDGNQGDHIADRRAIGSAKYVVSEPEGRAEKRDDADMLFVFQPKPKRFKDDAEDRQKTENVFVGQHTEPKDHGICGDQRQHRVLFHKGLIACLIKKRNEEGDNIKKCSLERSEQNILRNVKHARACVGEYDIPSAFQLIAQNEHRYRQKAENRCQKLHFQDPQLHGLR